MAYRNDGACTGSLGEQGRAIVEQLGGVWRHDGGMCRCPAHDDRSPSLSVRLGDRRLLFHCFAGCAASAILRALRVQGVAGAAAGSGTVRAADGPADPGRTRRDAAARLWSAARAITGTPAEPYLARRGLAPVSRELRFHPRTPCGRGRQAEFRPAMIAAVRDETGLVAVHRTFLDPRSNGLAPQPHPRRALGRLGVGAVRLADPRDGRLGWAEGIETALAATLLTGMPCWALLGTARFGRVALPAAVTRLVLFLDHDPAGRNAEALARKNQSCAGVTVDVCYPPRPGSDWNDVLIEQCPAIRNPGGEGAGGG